MKGTECLKFVGGQEDGKYHKVPRGISCWHIGEHQPYPRYAPGIGVQPCLANLRVFIYVRRGNEMVFDS